MKYLHDNNIKLGNLLRHGGHADRRTAERAGHLQTFSCWRGPVAQSWEAKCSLAIAHETNGASGTILGAVHTMLTTSDWVAIPQGAGLKPLLLSSHLIVLVLHAKVGLALLNNKGPRGPIVSPIWTVPLSTATVSTATAGTDTVRTSGKTVTSVDLNEVHIRFLLWLKKMCWDSQRPLNPENLTEAKCQASRHLGWVQT